jgi:hypothetical protein
MTNKWVKFRYPLRYSPHHLARNKDSSFFIIIFNDISGAINNMEYKIRKVFQKLH